MLQTFLKIIRSNHSPIVFLAMETIMTMVIDESEDIFLDLLSPLLASVRQENEIVSPISWNWGRKSSLIVLLSFKLLSQKQRAL